MRTLPKVGSRYGAPMRRDNNIVDRDYPVEFDVQRLRWVDGAYDEGGAYWGRSNDYIYWAEGESADDVETMFVRARTLTEAKAAILDTYPNATFAPSSVLDSFLAAYIAAALSSSSNERYQADMENEAEMLNDAGYDIAPETEAQMREDCANFLAANEDLIAQAISADVDYSIENAGTDFWLTRCGHGAGFWDRGLRVVGDELSRAAAAFGNVDLSVGDDDLVHASNEPISAPIPGL